MCQCNYYTCSYIVVVLLVILTKFCMLQKLLCTCILYPHIYEALLEASSFTELNHWFTHAHVFHAEYSNEMGHLILLVVYTL